MSQARQERASLLTNSVPGFARTALAWRACTLALILHLAQFRTLFDAHVLSVQHATAAPQLAPVMHFQAPQLSKATLASRMRTRESLAVTRPLRLGHRERRVTRASPAVTASIATRVTEAALS